METISTPAGTFHALKIEKIEDKGKQSFFWLLPEAGHLIIQAVSMKDDGADVTLSLKKGFVDGVSINGQ